MSAYEKIRKENIIRNEEFLPSIGIVNVNSGDSKSFNKRSYKKKHTHIDNKLKDEVPPTRKSRRLTKSYPPDNSESIAG